MLRDRLGLIVLVASSITAMGTIAGYFGLKNIRPVWLNEFEAQRAEQERKELWNVRRFQRLVDEALYALAREEKDDGLTPNIAERRLKLTQMKEWLNRQQKELEK